MAMTVMNNPSAMMSLGELNKNVSKLGKDLAKVASGQKIVGAGDGASEYAISERMRVRKRALDRDEANVQTGISLLNVAAGGIQQQIEIMKNIKAKVIDADNDSNTDLDRVTIQKEISQGLEHINDIAYETNYNGKLLLVGSKEIERITTWEKLPQPMIVEDSDLHLIPDVYDRLDGIEGPFDTMPFFDEISSTAEPLLGSDSVVTMSGGTSSTRDNPQTSTPGTLSVDFSMYADGTAADGVGFYTSDSSHGTKYYVLTTNPGKNYRHGSTATEENVIEIDVSGCNTSADIAAKVASVVKNVGAIGNATANGTAVDMTTSTYGSAANNTKVEGWAEPGAVAKRNNHDGVPTTYGRTGAVHTELSYFKNSNRSISASGTAPQNATVQPAVYDNVLIGYEKNELDEYIPVYKPVLVSPEIKKDGVNGTYANMNLNLNTVEAGSGVRITGSTGTAYVRFVRGSGGTPSEIPRDNTGVYIFDLNAKYDSQALCVWDNLNNKSTRSCGVNVSYANGTLSLASQYMGDTITVIDGFDSNSNGAMQGAPGKDSTYTDVNFQPVLAYPNTVTATGGADAGAEHDGNRASYTIDLSNPTDYDTTDSDVLESFIEELKGKNLNVVGYSWEFIDTKVDISFDAMKHSASNRVIDLNALRNAVSNGDTIADAFINLMVANNPSYYNGVSCFEDASVGGTKALKINAYNKNLAGNSDTISITKGIMSAYTIDFSNVSGIPDNLYNKGFRVYCATCPEQWMNFQFVDGNDSQNALRPKGISGADFKTTLIDVSNVTDVESLVQAIYDQGGDGLEHMKNNHSHFLHFAADPEAGKLTVYDDRMFDLRERRERYRDLQEKGSKLADGLYDDVQLMTRKLYVNDLIIHHTDKASMNIHLQIPQTSMDHIFGYNTKIKKYTDYDVLTVEHREELLGNQAGKMSRDGTRMVTENEPGLLDTAIQYLADAATLVGAQTSRLETTHDNIITQQESTAASESTIRDADMAKEMTEYTKSNILTQAAQSMLAQANQNASSVLSLLQ